MIALFSLFLAVFAPQGGHAIISGDLNCTSFNGTMFVYTPAATACQNAIADSSCAILYPAPVPADGYPTAGGNTERPRTCYTTAAATPAGVVQDIKTAALSSCAKTCGLCCQTDAYSCKNVDFPRVPCATVTNAQCLSPAWRAILAVDCPASCGLCGQGGCVDAVQNCANDISICQNIGMQDFVNTYCQKTCGRCPSTTTVSSGGYTRGNCASYAADTSSSCASWAKNGFCDNTFYTYDQRKARCATTCRMC